MDDMGWNYTIFPNTTYRNFVHAATFLSAIPRGISTAGTTHRGRATMMRFFRSDARKTVTTVFAQWLKFDRTK